MNTRIHLFKSLKIQAVICLLLVSSCDLFEQDAIEEDKQVVFGKKEFYTLPGSSAIIDFNSVVSKSFISASLVITQQPQRGELIELGSLLYKYTPSKDFTEGQDQFLISVKSEGKIIKTETFTISLSQTVNDLPCVLIAIEDKAKVSYGSSVSVNILTNDRICGSSTEDLHVSIHTNPKYGVAIVSEGSVIKYEPGNIFTGQDELIYEIKDSSGNSSSYGVFSITEGQKIEILEVPGNVRSNVFFIDENIGFLGAVNALYKTIDGGVNWQTMPITGSDEHMEIRSIFFVDNNHGFATYHTGSRPGGGVIRTSDGGTNWTIQKFDHDLTSVYFTSVSTGFISMLTYGQDSTRITKILATRNGGLTWDEVFSSLANVNHSPGLSGFNFINPSTGYFVLNEWHNESWDYNTKVYRTFNNGVTWDLVIEGSEIASYGIAPGNRLVASSGNEIRLVIAEEDPINKLVWYKVFENNYPIYLVGFSRSGNTGYALGSSFDTPDPLHGTLNINRTINQGASWKEEELDEPIPGVPNSMSIPSDHVVYILCFQTGFSPFIVKCSK